MLQQYIDTYIYNIIYWSESVKLFTVDIFYRYSFFILSLLSEITSIRFIINYKWKRMNPGLESSSLPYSIVNSIAQKVVEITLNYALNYVYSNTASTNIDYSGQGINRIYEEIVDGVPSIIEFIGNQEEGQEINIINMSSSMDSNTTSTDNNNTSNLKSAFVPTPRKRTPAKDGRKRSVQFAPEFIKGMGFVS